MPLKHLRKNGIERLNLSRCVNEYLCFELFSNTLAELLKMNPNAPRQTLNA